MKKIVLSTLFGVTMAANAADVSVNYVRDYNVDRDGVRLETSVGQFLGITPTVGVTHVEGVYTRWSAGSSFDLLNVGPVVFAASGTGVYQNTVGADNGYGFTVGANAKVDLTKNVSLKAGVERFYGQDRISASNGTLATVGVSVGF